MKVGYMRHAGADLKRMDTQLAALQSAGCETVYTDDARTYWFKLDGKNIYPNPQGPNGQGQTAGMWLIDRNTIFRERATKGVIDERVLYRVSPDGQTLTWTGFNADRDSSQTAWDRIDLPAR